ncbi:MAG: hypothetical protein AABX28_01330 [Nanoarchaeota archaeon]
MRNKYGTGNHFIERSQPREPKENYFYAGSEGVEQGISSMLPIKETEQTEQTRRYTDFIKMSRGLNPENIFDDTSGKTEALRKGMSYTHLIVERGRRMRLEDCSEARIGNAFRNAYNTATKRLSRQR